MGQLAEADSDQHYADARREMVEDQLARRGITDPRVLDAMSRVPRHLFVPAELQEASYADTPLPIGKGQTISQPYVVGLMTQLLHTRPTDRVLEIGVGSGYQTAVLCCLVREVIGIERIPTLAHDAEARLKEMGCENVAIYIEDGSSGFMTAAPYDGILAAAAAPNLPEPLLEQLAEGGRLIIPVGDPQEQVIERVRRRGETYHIERLTPVRFVPLIGKHGFKRGW